MGEESSVNMSSLKYDRERGGMTVRKNFTKKKTVINVIILS